MAATDQKVQLPEAGQNALDWYLEFGEADDLKTWLQTDEGQSYLSDLHDALPQRLTVYRGLNGVLASDSSATNVGAYDDPTDAPQYGGRREGVTSWTDQRLVAESFATGDRHIIESPEPYGVVVEASVPASQIVFHSDYVETDGRFDEAEVTLWK